jgi:3-hydroxyacyl-CoA dehydrogenase
MNSPKRPDKSTSAPAPAGFDAPFWEAAREGRLLLRHCPACQRLHHYPRPHCPFCGHASTEWREVSGHGHVHASTRVERAPRPTAPAIVELAEGPRISSAVLDADVHALRIGDPVQVRFVPGEGGALALAFTTPQAEAARRYSRAARAALGQPDAAAAQAAQALQHAAVIGAGHMGSGIALALLAGGLQVVLIDPKDEALQGARERMTQALSDEVTRGRLSASDMADRLQRLRTASGLPDAAGAQLVIEAVFEDMALKQSVFAELDRIVGPDALLASNTSTLDVGAIAAATAHPERVLGLHFFNPAQRMRLVEVVRAPSTGAPALDLARALVQRLGKVPVVVGICHGFVGNRLMITREREAARLLLEGALPEQIDRVQRQFGLPMGTFELQDMAGGIALTYHARRKAGQSDWLIEQLFARGRLGLRAGKGYYRYEPGQRRPMPDPEVRALIEQASAEAGVQRRRIGDDEIRDRLFLLMINEGTRLIEEGMVERPSDIDVVWQLGYGWPDWKGGPMYHADQLGLAQVQARLQALQAAHGERFAPSAQLARCVREGRSLTSHTS